MCMQSLITLLQLSTSVKNLRSRKFRVKKLNLHIFIAWRFRIDILFISRFWVSFVMMWVQMEGLTLLQVLLTSFASSGRPHANMVRRDEVCVNFGEVWMVDRLWMNCN